MAGWHAGRISLLSGLPPGYGILSWMEDAPDTTPAVATAIRQLAADWLASEGVVASRWRTGTPGREGVYWVEDEAADGSSGPYYEEALWKNGRWFDEPENCKVRVLRWQELDGINYEVSHE